MPAMMNTCFNPPLMPGNYDLYVHIQTGETLSIMVDNGVQHIQGERRERERERERKRERENDP